MNPSRLAQKLKPELRFLFPLVLVIALAVGLYSINLGVIQTGDPDEGVYLGAARLINYGYPYARFFFDQFALFPEMLALALRIGGDTLLSARILILLFSASGLFAVAFLTRALGSRLASVLAVLLTALHPYYLTTSRYTMGEIPGVALALWACAAILAFTRHRARAWLILAGILMTASVLVKPLTVSFVIPLLVWLVWARIHATQGATGIDWRALLLDGFVLVSSGIVTALPFLDWNLSEQFRATVLFHRDELAFHGATLGSRLEGLRAFSLASGGWLGLALVGVLSARSLQSLLPLLAAEAATVILLLQLPPFNHHYALLVPVLGIVAAVGIEQGAQHLYRVLRSTVAHLRARQKNASMLPRASALLAAVAAGLALVLALASLPQIELQNRLVLVRARRNKDAVVARLAQRTQPGAFVLCDDPIVVYLAGRLLAPSAINLSYVSTFELDPTAYRRLDETMQEYPLAAVVVTGAFRSDPKLMAWVKSTFPVSRRVVGVDGALSADIYSRRGVK